MPEITVLLIPYGVPAPNFRSLAAAHYIFQEVEPGDWRTKKARIGEGQIKLVTAGSYAGQPSFTLATTWGGLRGPFEDDEQPFGIDTSYPPPEKDAFGNPLPLPESIWQRLRKWVWPR